jgi:carbonic anhydrase
MPEQTLQRLLEGNRHFAEGKLTLDASPQRRMAVAARQQPIATILGCVDSRVPPELIFNQGLGELFVIRTAGEVMGHAVLGSLEFGVLELHIPLIMVLGHRNCGALIAASEALHHHEKTKADIQFLVKKLALAVETGDKEEGDHLDRAVRAQINYNVEKLKSMPIFKKEIGKGKLNIVGGWYDLDTGLVDIVIE